MQAPQPSPRSAYHLLSQALSRFGALWRRSTAFKGALAIAATLALLPVAALSLRPGGSRHGDAMPPSIAPSVTAPATQTVAVDQPPAAAAPSAGRAGKSLAPPSRPDASGTRRTGVDPAGAMPMDKTAADYVMAQGMTVPLPPGQWVVVAHVPAPDRGGLESLFLAQVRRDKLSRAVLVRATMQADESATGFRRSAPCARPGVLYAKTIANEELGRQDCWTIDHDASTRSERDTAPMIGAAIGELELRGIKYPPVLLSAFFRLADKQRSLDAVYYFNPETDGITSRPTSWEESDWNRNDIYKYPDKIAYVEKLRAWAEAWHPAVRDGFLGAGPAQGDLPVTARKP
jgi:hypothetical protein